MAAPRGNETHTGGTREAFCKWCPAPSRYSPFCPDGPIGARNISARVAINREDSEWLGSRGRRGRGGCVKLRGQVRSVVCLGL
jgi:hypothetical protein